MFCVVFTCPGCWYIWRNTVTGHRSSSLTRTPDVASSHGCCYRGVAETACSFETVASICCAEISTKCIIRDNCETFVVSDNICRFRSEPIILKLRHKNWCFLVLCNSGMNCCIWNKWCFWVGFAHKFSVFVLLINLTRFCTCVPNCPFRPDGGHYLHATFYVLNMTSRSAAAIQCLK